MGSANSRQKIARPFLDIGASLWRRTHVWESLQALVRRIQNAAGLGRSQLSSTAPSSPGPQLVQPPQNLDHDDASAPQTQAAAKDADPDSSDAAKDDRIVENITKALQDAAPRPSARLKIDDQTPDLPTIYSTTSASEAREPEQHPAHSSRKVYESRVRDLEAVYDRVGPQSDQPPKIKTSVERPYDEYDNQVADYVFSSLLVALPQPQSAERATTTAFQSLDANMFRHVAVRNDGGPEETTANSRETPAVSTERPMEQEEQAVLTNYRTWDRELYSKLSLDQSSIRLVEIKPGSTFDKVSVSMNVHPLKDVSMQYEALSYVWGNPQPAKNIFVNNVEVPINPNLHDALVSLRQHDSSRRVWIDAISLNQTSFAEKSKEVQKMGEIYSLAKTVIVFLGAPPPPEPDPTSIGDLIRFLSRDDHDRASDRYAQQGLGGLTKVLEKCETDVHAICKGFVEACLRPWWGRIWTLQEFYLAKEEPVWHWGRDHASNASLKRDFPLLMDLCWELFTREDAKERKKSDLKVQIGKPIDSFKAQVERISTLISRRYRTNGFDNPRRLYRELTAQATNPRDFVYGLRAIFDPVFGKVFVPDYSMRTELLFACLAVFLIQFESWGDVLWWYPFRYGAEQGLFPSWLPNFTQRIMPHELDVQPLDLHLVGQSEPKMVVLNHRLHAEGYILDTVYAHRHVDNDNHQKILEELWQFDHCMNHNHECHTYLIEGAASEDWGFKAFHGMYQKYYTRLTHFNSAFRGTLLQSTIRPEDSDKLPRQIAECVPCWDLLRWHALGTTVQGLPEALESEGTSSRSGQLENIFSPRMRSVFENGYADFFVGACIFDWNHLFVWLDRFPTATQWSSTNEKYWSAIHESLPEDTEKRAKPITEAYWGYEREISPEVMKVSWCYSFYYTFLAYLILLDCDNHASLASMISKLRAAGEQLRQVYFSTTTAQIEKFAAAVPSIATRVAYYTTVIDLFRGRQLVWTKGGFRGTCCPGVETCCEKNSILAAVDGLSFPLIVRDFNEETGEGWLAGCALIRGVDTSSGSTERMTLPPDCKLGEKRLFKFR